jgi:MFS transporter, ACS family, glucarate transporter
MPTTLGGRTRWLLVGWMFILSASMYLDRVNISVSGQFLQREFNLNDTELGWVFSAFVLGYALCQAPGGRLADRFGPRKVLALGSIWWAVFTTVTSCVPSGIAGLLGILITVRLLLGFGEAVVYPACNRMVAAWVPTQERGLANGIIFAGVGLGAGTAPPLITWVILNWGWRWSFRVTALMGLAAAVVWVLVARNKPAAHPWVGEKELAHIQAGLTDKGVSGGEPVVLSWLQILRSKDVRFLTLSYATFGYVAYIFFTWFFIYLSKVRGLDLKSSSYYGMLPFLAMAAASPLGGWLGDGLTKRHGKFVGRSVVAAAGLGAAGIFVAFATQVPDARLACFVLAAGAGSVYVSQSAFWAVSADLGGASAGSVSGIMNMGCQLAGALTASLTPYLAAHFGWTASFLTAAGLCVLGALSWLAVDPNARLEA